MNVGYDIYRIKTRVSEQGTKLDAGFDYQKRDRLTREKRWAVQDEEESFQKTQLDRSVVVPDQIRKIIATFREKLFTDLFPDRAQRAEQMGMPAPWVPKTLIFAKDDNHAEDIVHHVRAEFGKGNDFCKKVTYKASGKSEDIIKAFRTAPEKRRRLVGVLDEESGANVARRVSRRAEPANQSRIAVTVDMIATDTDIKPLECLLFLRDVRSQLYFEQMKGRGTRVLASIDLKVAFGEQGGAIIHFVIVDAVSRSKRAKTRNIDNRLATVHCNCEPPARAGALQHTLPTLMKTFSP